MSNFAHITAELRAKYGQTGPAIDPEVIAEGEGVDVRYVSFEGDATHEFHGFYDFEERTIFVNKDDSVEEKLFTIAHEFAHHLLHATYAESTHYIPRLKRHVDSAEEREADLFAVNLLAPVDMLNEFSKVKTDADLCSLFLITPEILGKARLAA